LTKRELAGFQLFYFLAVNPTITAIMTIPTMTMPSELETTEQPHLPGPDFSGYDVNEAFIHQAIEQAAAPVLRLALLQVTSDPDLEKMKVLKTPIRGGVLNDYTLSEADEKIVRDKAFKYLSEGPHEAPPPPPKEEAFRLMDLYSDAPMRTTPNEPSYDYEEGYEELAFEPYPRDVNWTGIPPPSSTLAKWKVLIVGAGLSGIAAAIPLKKLGIPFEIIERQAGTGGTWLLNTYPDVRVDTLVYLFQYKFEKNYPWKDFFAAGADLQKYIDYVATKWGVKEHIKFNTEVVAAKWDESKKVWNMTTQEKGGRKETTTCNAIVSAAGLFSTPNLPDIPGIHDFKGPLFHTAQWDHSTDYHGKNVAVIGTGSTGTQLTPMVAEGAKRLSVYMRTPQWIASYEGYRATVTEQMHWMCDHMPYYWHWYCYAAWFRSLQLANTQYHDPEWRAQGGLINKRNDFLRQSLTKFINEKFSDRPDLLAKVTPKIAPMVRRLVVDNGFYDALKRDNVSLITEDIERITEKGIKTVDGNEIEYDLIILGAGFKTSQYLWPVDYTGTQGMTLTKAWAKDGARSYLGMTMPHYPNLFTLYGPNHQPRGGSLYSYAEMWARYAVASIVGMIERGANSMEVKHDVFDAYQAKLDQGNKKIIWESEGSSYYVNEHGRQAVNMPWTTAEYHPMIIKPNFDDYDFTYEEVESRL
jgi:4-hydroxyacetophenone monooxygenase